MYKKKKKNKIIDSLYFNAVVKFLLVDETSRNTRDNDKYVACAYISSRITAMEWDKFARVSCTWEWNFI